MGADGKAGVFSPRIHFQVVVCSHHEAFVGMFMTILLNGVMTARPHYPFPTVMLVFNVIYGYLSTYIFPSPSFILFLKQLFSVFFVSSFLWFSQGLQM